MKKDNFLRKYFLIILSILIVSSFSINSIAVRVDKWSVVEEEEITPAFVFYQWLHSWFETEHLKDNEFLLGDVIDYCYVSIIKRRPTDLEIKPERIKFTSPSKKSYEINLTGGGDYFYAGKFTKSKEKAMITLNESGIWSINIIFNNENPLILISTVDFEVFTNNSEIHIYYGSNINVYTNLEYQQLRVAKAMEESAIADEESSFWSKISAIFLFIASLTAIVSIYLTHKRYKKEKEDEKKEKIRAKKEECKHVPSDCLTDIRFLISDTKELLDYLKKHNYQYHISSSDELQKYDKIKKRFHELRQKLTSNISYVITYPEAKDISDDLNSISIDYIVFINTSLEKISNPTTKEDVERAYEELSKLEKSIKEFLLKKIKIE